MIGVRVMLSQLYRDRCAAYSVRCLIQIPATLMKTRYRPVWPAFGSNYRAESKGYSVLLVASLLGSGSYGNVQMARKLLS